MILETERLLLRPWEESDAEELYKYAKDPQIGPITGWPPHKSVDDSRTVIRAVLSAPGESAIVLKETGLPVGGIGYHDVRLPDGMHAPGEQEIGFWLGREYRGRGLMPEAVNAVTDCLFRTTDCAGIWCGHFAGNERSARVQEKCGFVFRCRLENMPVKLLGETRDEIFSYLSRADRESGILIRTLSEREKPAANDLIREVFLAFDAVYDTDEGRQFFLKRLYDPFRTASLRYYGAFDGGTLAGVLAMQENGKVGGFFVRGEYHRRGLGTRLMQRMRRDLAGRTVTVDASPYATDIYRRLGFVPTGALRTENGLAFTPMKLEIPEE